MVSYAYLFHRREIWMAFKSIDFKLRFWQKKKDEDGTEVFLFNDVHNRLMRKYPEGRHAFHTERWVNRLLIR